MTHAYVAHPMPVNYSFMNPHEVIEMIMSFIYV